MAKKPVSHRNVQNLIDSIDPLCPHYYELLEETIDGLCRAVKNADGSELLEGFRDAIQDLEGGDAFTVLASTTDQTPGVLNVKLAVDATSGLTLTEIVGTSWSDELLMDVNNSYLELDATWGEVGDIAAVGTAASAGSTGKHADAGHVHAISFSTPEEDAEDIEISYAAGTFTVKAVRLGPSGAAGTPGLWIADYGDSTNAARSLHKHNIVGVDGLEDALGTIPSLSDATPEAVAATGNSGTSSDVSRADHVHAAAALQIVCDKGNETTTTIITSNTSGFVINGADHDYSFGYADNVGDSTSDLVITVDGGTPTEILRYDQSAAQWLVPSTAAIAFRDAALYIGSDDDGHLDLHADTQIDLNKSVAVSDSGGTTITLTEGASAGSGQAEVICQSSGDSSGANVGGYRVDNLGTGKRWLWKMNYPTDDFELQYYNGSSWAVYLQGDISEGRLDAKFPFMFSGNVGFYGTAPVAQPAAPSDAATQDLSGSDTVDRTKLEADLNSCKTAVNTLIDRLQSLGLLS